MKMSHKFMVSAGATLGLLAGASPAMAAASASIYDCTVSVSPPFINYRGGLRGAETNVYVRCTVGRTGIVNGQILEDDVVSNDEVTGLRSASFTIQAGQTQKVLTMWGGCNNFDPTGAEELFTKAKINVGGRNSSWASSAAVSASC